MAANLCESPLPLPQLLEELEEFLIRRRMAKLQKKVLLIQKVYRKWLSLPKMRRLIHLRTAVIRKQQAKLIQNYWRQHAEKNLVKKIQQGERPTTTT